MIRRPPRSPLFPCTTLSRSLPHLLRRGDGGRIEVLDLGPDADRELARVEGPDPVDPALPRDGRPPRRARVVPRSEEHTSELQSQSNLVCRLLLANKHCLSTS